MPIRPAAKQIGERFGRFDSAVRTSSPLPSYFIFILTPTPADPIGASSLGNFSPIHASPSEAVVIHNRYGPIRVWGCTGVVGDIVGIGETVRLEIGTSE